MSLPLVQSHICARHALPKHVACASVQKQAARGSQRQCSKQRSLSSCSALRGQHLPEYSHKPRTLRNRTAAVARQARTEEDEEEEDEEEQEQEGEEDVAEEADETAERTSGRADAEDTMMDEEDDGFQERVVQVRRVTKVAKGGKSMAFRAVVVVGDEQGQVGVGCASAKEVVTAVAKAVVQAKMEIIKVPLTSSATFPHKLDGYAGAAKVMLRPASEGTGVIAGGAVRVVLELAGVKNAFGKQLGSQNPLNNARATIAGLSEMRTFRDVARTRGLSPQEVLSQMTAGQRTASSTAAGEKFEAQSTDEPAEAEPAVVKPSDDKSQLRGPDLPPRKKKAEDYRLEEEWNQLLSDREAFEDKELAAALRDL